MKIAALKYILLALVVSLFAAAPAGAVEDVFTMPVNSGLMAQLNAMFAASFPPGTLIVKPHMFVTITDSDESVTDFRVRVQYIEYGTGAAKEFTRTVQRDGRYTNLAEFCDVDRVTRVEVTSLRTVAFWDRAGTAGQ